eukprot:CAMPEP_0116883374 /NCGR_PEP_ID=MMETSP0463-20121206/15877_1 /TAXON_ID=181622 /ORGANISM="Strombidinopsis sp, Strain SopsisLIS2011" /LENGTH=77 /DNA_ID=CAMNT_0004538037 /DNA_START=1144 /DNA_END=1377 /DNA_ORIENTATION=-
MSMPELGMFLNPFVYVLFFALYVPLLVFYNEDIRVINEDIDEIANSTWTEQCVDPYASIGNVDYIRDQYAEPLKNYR